jgi:hypothetical protein
MKCDSSFEINAATAQENAATIAIVTGSDLPPETCKITHKNTEHAVIHFAAHLGGGCGSSSFTFDINSKYSVADAYAHKPIKATQNHPPNPRKNAAKTPKTNAETVLFTIFGTFFFFFSSLATRNALCRASWAA